MRSYMLLWESEQSNVVMVGGKTIRQRLGWVFPRFNVCMLHSEERYPAVVTAGDSWWSWLLFWMSVSGDKRQQVCVCVQFQPLEKEKYSLLFFFFIRLRTHTWRSKSVLFYAFMRMYSVLDCRQAKRKIFSLFHTAPMGVRFNSQTQIHTRL